MSRTGVVKSPSHASQRSEKPIQSKTKISKTSLTSKNSNNSKSPQHSKLSTILTVESKPSASGGDKRSSSTSLKKESIKASHLGEVVEEVEEEQIEEKRDEKPLTNFHVIWSPKEMNLEEFQKQSLHKGDLFPKVVTLNSHDTIVEVTKKEVPSILVEGFGMRNLKSLQDALEEENKRVLELFKRQQEQQAAASITKPSQVSVHSCTSRSSRSILVHKSSSETLTDESENSGDKYKLQYLMGLHQDEEEEYEEIEPESEFEKKTSFIYSTSTSMKIAQHYLRIHRIFDFFQFIIAQLLGSTPDNPIHFILELLNKCLLYRSGAGPPPLLYEAKHISQLFSLMDRINTGFIDMDQYVQGMVTLGICEYNKDPDTTDEGISRETFAEEVYEAELNLFDDLIRRKYIDKKGRKDKDKAINYAITKQDSKTSYFMPSDLFSSLKPLKLSQIKEDTEPEQEG